MCPIPGSLPVLRKMRPTLRLTIAYAATLGLSGLACATPSASAAPAQSSTMSANVSAAATSAAATPGTGHESSPGQTGRAARHKSPARDPKAARILDVEGVGAVTVYAPQGTPKGLA